MSHRASKLRYLWLLLLVMVSTLLTAQTKRICLTVDDLPVVTYGQFDADYKRDLTLDLVTFFEEHSIPAIGYVNEGKLYRQGRLDEATVDLLRLWLDHGLELGNHTYSHKSYHKTDFDTYTADIVQGEEVTRPLLSGYGLELSYFRHPFLHIGATEARVDSLQAFLASRDLIASPVTIDTEDYQFAIKYAKALERGDTAAARAMGDAYVSYVREAIVYFENLSHSLFGRQMPQTLLMHANKLNADYLPDLYQVLRDLDYSFVSQEEVLKDPAYETPISRFGPWGISWLERWAMDSDAGRELMQTSPAIPGILDN